MVFGGLDGCHKDPELTPPPVPESVTVPEFPNVIEELETLNLGGTVNQTSLPSNLSLRDALVTVARSQVGVHEVGGNNRGPQVDAYNQSVPVPLGSPWCASSLNWISMEAAGQLGVPSPYPRTARAIIMGKQFTLKGRPVKPGDTFYIGSYSHTGMFEEDGDMSVTTLEGNTSPAPGDISEDRDGDVFTRKKRLRASIRYGADWVKD